MSIEVQWGRKTRAEDGTLVSEPRLEFGYTTFSVRVIEPARMQPSHHDADPEAGAVLVNFNSIGLRGQHVALDHIPYEDDGFAWAADLLFRRLGGQVRPVHMRFWAEPEDHPGGEWLPVERERVREVSVLESIGPIWCPVANMRAERPYGPDGQEIRRGSRHFAPGAKLYCADSQWGDGYDQIEVAGHHRGSHRWVKMIVSSSWLTNWRLELVYDPAVIKAFWPDWDGGVAAMGRAQKVVDMMRGREAAQNPPEQPTP